MPTIDAVLDEARGFVIRAGGSRQHHDSKASWLHRAAARLGLPYGRAASLYYRRARTIPADEYLRLKAEIEAMERAEEARGEALNEIARLAMAGTHRGVRPAEGAAQRKAGTGAAGASSVVPMVGEG